MPGFNQVAILEEGDSRGTDARLGAIGRLKIDTGEDHVFPVSLCRVALRCAGFEWGQSLAARGHLGSFVTRWRPDYNWI